MYYIYYKMYYRNEQLLEEFDLCKKDYTSGCVL